MVLPRDHHLMVVEVASAAVELHTVAVTHLKVGTVEQKAGDMEAAAVVGMTTLIIMVVIMGEILQASMAATVLVDMDMVMAGQCMVPLAVILGMVSSLDMALGEAMVLVGLVVTGLVEDTVAVMVDMVAGEDMVQVWKVVM